MSDSPQKSNAPVNAEEATEAKLCAYLEDALAPEDRAEIEQYLKNNPQHRQLLAELAQTRQLIRRLPRQAAPPEIAEAFEQQMERAMLLDGSGETPPEVRRGRWSQQLLVAALVLLAAGLGVLVYFALPGSNPSGQRFATGGFGGAPSPAPPTTPTLAVPPPAPTPQPPATQPVPAARMLAKAEAPAPSPAPATPTPAVATPTASTPAAVPLAEPPPAASPTAPAINPPHAAGNAAEEASSTLSENGPSAESPPGQNAVLPLLQANGLPPDQTAWMVLSSPDPSVAVGDVQQFLQGRHLAYQMVTPSASPAAAPIAAWGASARPTTWPATMPATQPAATPAAAANGSQALLAHDVSASELQLLANLVEPERVGFFNPLAVAPAATQPTSQPASIGPGQRLTVTVDQLVGPGVQATNTVSVGPDGTIMLPMMIEPLPAAGKTPAELAADIAARYRDMNLIPNATVRVTTAAATQPSTEPTTQAAQAMAAQAMAAQAMAAQAMAAQAMAAQAMAAQPMAERRVNLLVLVQPPAAEPTSQPSP